VFIQVLFNYNLLILIISILIFFLPILNSAIGYTLYEISSSGLTHYAAVAQPLFDYILASDYSVSIIIVI
jgi:hypothetical protein